MLANVLGRDLNPVRLERSMVGLGGAGRRVVLGVGSTQRFGLELLFIALTFSGAIFGRTYFLFTAGQPSEQRT